MNPNQQPNQQGGEGKNLSTTHGLMRGQNGKEGGKKIHYHPFGNQILARESKEKAKVTAGEKL